MAFCLFEKADKLHALCMYTIGPHYIYLTLVCKTASYIPKLLNFHDIYGSCSMQKSRYAHANSNQKISELTAVLGTASKITRRFVRPSYGFEIASLLQDTLMCLYLHAGTQSVYIYVPTATCILGNCIICIGLH